MSEVKEIFGNNKKKIREGDVRRIKKKFPYSKGCKIERNYSF